MHLSRIPQCTIMNALLWDVGQVHCGICEMGLFTDIWGLRRQKQVFQAGISNCIPQEFCGMRLLIPAWDTCFLHQSHHLSLWVVVIICSGNGLAPRHYLNHWWPDLLKHIWDTRLHCLHWNETWIFIQSPSKMLVLWEQSVLCLLMMWHPQSPNHSGYTWLFSFDV